MNAVTVMCEDGMTRHSESFATVAEAERWADYGHICTASHLIRSGSASVWHHFEVAS